MSCNGWLVFAMFGAMAVASRAQTPQAEDLVKVVLMSDVTVVQPGRPFTVGVMFTIEPGWHIYWTNPGDSGEATRVEFNVPPGFKVGEVRYPVPVKFEQAGDIVGYGYHDKVLLTAVVTPLTSFSVGQTIPISAEVAYLVCEKVCIPGSANVELSLPVREQAQGTSRSEFEIAEKQIPQPAAKIAASTSYSIDQPKQQATLTIDWPDQPESVGEWFPPTSESMNFTDVNVSTSGKRSTVTFKFSTFAGKSLEQGRLQSVLAYNDREGTRRGILVPFELTQAK